VRQWQEEERLYQALELAKSQKEKAVQEAVDQLITQARSKHLQVLKSSEEEHKR
jgi:hypothetical protein